MGCDIHMHTEVKIDGVWHHYSAPSISRSYALFGKMAGVRSTDETPVAQPKGIPEDATALTKFDYQRWGDDAHTPSWLNAQEILEVCDWANEKWRSEEQPWMDWECDEVGYFFGNTWSGFTKYPSGYSSGDRTRIEDIRWIFWFDN